MKTDKKQARWRRLIRKAANLLRTKGWSKATLARDYNGLVVSLESPEASSFCMIGAILKASGTKDNSRLMEVKYYPLSKDHKIPTVGLKGSGSATALKALQEIAKFYHLGNGPASPLYRINDSAKDKFEVIEKMLKVANQ